MRISGVMKTIEHIQNFISNVTRWASTQSDIKAIALVGSYARDAVTEDSDIDFVMLVDHPGRYLEDIEWLRQFGSVERQQVEYYGLVTSLRVWYADGREVEYGITTRHWAAVPLDEGTQQVINDGMKVLFEREALLSVHLGS
jgi:predicted nucleotidyltransferase